MFMAQSANAKIARKNGDEDFLSPRNWEEFKRIAENIGVFAIGRKTYESVKNWEDKGFRDINSKRLVLSNRSDFSPEEGYTKVSSPVEAVEKVSDMGFEKLLITGGATVNTSFVEEKMVNKIILNIEPYILGQGIDLFDEKDFEEQLKLDKVKKLDKGIIQIQYNL